MHHEFHSAAPIWKIPRALTCRSLPIPAGVRRSASLSDPRRDASLPLWASQAPAPDHRRTAIVDWPFS
jgi:hypothetical protein